MSSNASLRAVENPPFTALLADAQAAVRAFATAGAIDAAALAAFGPGVPGAAVAAAIFSFGSAGWPRLVLMDDEALHGARGAYDRASDTIYLAREFASHASAAAVVAVIVEEIGHAIDARVNESDARGDEGAIFSLFVLGQPPGERELAALQAESDHGTISVDGNPVAVEFASNGASAKVAIVYSATNAANYWDSMAYSKLFMNAQSQAAMAGVPYDILTESDLTNVATLQQYDALIFPVFQFVKASDVAAITDALTQASQSYGVALVTSGDFMTNNENGGALANPYARMSTLLGLEPQAYGSGSIAVRANNAHTMMSEYAAGELIRSYDSGFYAAYRAITGVTADVIAQQTIGGQTYNAVIGTTIGGPNVHFSTAGVMADDNLLWQAIDYVVNGNGVTAGLALSRNDSIVAARVDMDLAFAPETVNPPDGAAGIYDRLLLTLQQWKTEFGFVGSFYVDIGDNPPSRETNWGLSRAYYQQILALGNELGSHTISHPFDANALTAAQVQYEFETSKLIIEQQIAQTAGGSFVVDGAAVPGAPENLQTALGILQYYDYLSGGFSSVGAGYPNAFGYLTPAMRALDKVYIAPNLTFDFTLVEFQGLTPQQAAARWASDVADLSRHADVPILVWPWHDYAVTEWQDGPGIPSLYTTAMFTDFVARAHAAGAEFVTLDDLAERLSSFARSTVSWSVSGTTVTATVTSPDAGKFTFDLDNLGSQKIARVDNWYAYDDDSVFLPANGGTYIIRLGSISDDVTRIISLPMRSELISVTGNGTDLSFSIFGEGRVVVDLPAGRQAVVTGATIVSRVGDKLTLDLGPNGQHDVSVTSSAGAPRDILWRDSDGTVATWEMDGAGQWRGYLLSAVPLSWSVIDGHGDYNGDGRSDLLWRNSDGTVATWEMDGAGQWSGYLLSAVPLSWSVIDGHGDYNGDGRSDLLWRNSDGTVATWEMDGAGQWRSYLLSAVPLSWSVIDGHGDYNGDGHSDLLWRSSDGTVATWEMDGAGQWRSYLLSAVPLSWSVIDGHGDYNGDGRSDLLWRNSDGTVATWEMDGAGQWRSYLLSAVPLSWSVIDGHGDYNGDGRSDLLWRSSDGTVATWEMDGAGQWRSYLLSAVPLSWSVIDGHGDYNGDGRSDLLWRNSDGTVATWEMDGAGQWRSYLLSAVPASWSVVDGAELGATINGSDGSDSLTGTVGRDTLSGNLGNDTLTGGAGADRFVFDTVPGASNVDIVTDFVSGTDRLVLSELLYASPARGTLSAAHFVAEANVSAHDANDFILYDTSSGALYYDADGAGAQAAVQFATLLNHPLLVAQDVYVGLL